MKRLVLGITSPGSGPLIKGQAAYFKSLGYEVFLMAPEGEKITSYCKEEGCTHVPVQIVRPIQLLKDLRAFLQIARALRRIRPDVVNVGTPKMGLLGMLGAKFVGVKTRVYTCRGFRYEHEKGFKRKLLLSMEQLSAAFAQKVVCISRSVQERGISDGVFSEKKAILIGKGSSNGVDLKFFDPQGVNVDEALALKETLALKGKFVYGFVGRIMDRKGINELYSAFVKVHEQDKDAVLLIVGGVTNDQVSDKDLLQKFKEHPAIYWVGFQQNVPLYMSMLDVFVLPAWWEGFGNVLIQSAAMGIPVISTDGTGCRDAFSAGYNGLCVPVKNVPALGRAMQVYRHNETLKISHGKNGKEWAKNFPSETIWDGLHELYKSLGK
ncbi:glycosyltransferase family 4 protein [Pedobacter sp. ASV28]|uniref:glycosyltransferase family 4 protein n=1 Tax=Pedobacter sp. ASV28 TaxID=2795123 RepID=UPI0018EC6ECC|nr:glycosyltransferase family 4 protein [Pedobacter sp. ASV28]